MKKKKQIRTIGKIKLSEYFKELKIGESVGIVKDASHAASFPDRIHGATGVIESKRGKAYVVKLNDFNKEKRFIIQAIHLKKLNNNNKMNVMKK